MFKDYIVLVTGASSGLGLAAAQEFLAQGATVIGTGRELNKCSKLGDRFFPIYCEFRNGEDINAVVEFVKEKFGKLDVLVNNAGAAVETNIATVTPELIQENFDVLYKGHTDLTSKCVELLKKSDNPSVIFTSSVGSLAVDYLGSDFGYHAMKAAINAFSRCCASYSGMPLMEGIRCNTICPGYIRTPLMSDAVWSFVESSPMVMNLPLHRIGKPEEFAKLVAFLASPKASYINGAVINIDGGFSAGNPRIGMMN